MDEIVTKGIHMIDRYNFVYIPQVKRSEVIKLAQQFTSVADRYLLGSNSIPHVTLFQFETNQKEIFETWQLIHNKVSNHRIELHFNEVSFTTSNQQIYWLSLLPDHQEIIFAMHQCIADTLALPPRNNYEPHMTLCNTSQILDVEAATKLISPSLPIIDDFEFALGKADEVWQLTEILFHSNQRDLSNES